MPPQLEDALLPQGWLILHHISQMEKSIRKKVQIEIKASVWLIYLCIYLGKLMCLLLHSWVKAGKKISLYRISSNIFCSWFYKCRHSYSLNITAKRAQGKSLSPQISTGAVYLQKFLIREKPQEFNSERSPTVRNTHSFLIGLELSSSDQLWTH